MADYQDAIHHRVTTIDPDGCAQVRCEHSVGVIVQTSIWGRAKHLTDDNPQPISWVSASLRVCLWCQLPRGNNERKEQISMSISRLKALRCRRMLLALPGPRPGNHLRLPRLSAGTDTRYKGQKVMTPRKILSRGGSGSVRRTNSSRTRLRILLALPAAAVAATALVACSSAGASPTPSSSPSSSGSSSSSAAAGASTLKTTTIGGATVLTNSKGFTLYSFAPDTSTTSKCNGTCAQNWPPVTGPVTAAGVTGTFGTIKRSDGSVQATFDGHPLYAFVGDATPGQAKGNGLNAAGGLWHEVTSSGT